MKFLQQLPTPAERVVFVVLAIAVFLLLEFFILGWLSEIPARARLLMGHLGNYLEFLAAIVGAFAFLWHKRFSDSKAQAEATRLLNSRIASVYGIAQSRNEADFSKIVEAANAVVAHRPVGGVGVEVGRVIDATICSYVGVAT
jgi:hypothetical protein